MVNDRCFECHLSRQTLRGPRVESEPLMLRPNLVAGFKLHRFMHVTYGKHKFEHPEGFGVQHRVSESELNPA